MPSAVTTRFAPSPTGRLHLGHAYAALFAERAAREAGGRFLLRIDDMDQGRCRPAFEDGIFEDLAWLGLTWEEPVLRQSARSAVYRAAIGRLAARGLVYPCFCSRKDIQAEIAAAANAPHGPDGPLYPGTCRGLTAAEISARRARGETPALRLDMEKALRRIDGPLRFRELGQGPEGEQGVIEADPARFGDFVLDRKDAPASYHLAVVVDDADHGVTLVTRGQDLFASSHVHRLLQALLDLSVPDYRHHDLVTDESGRRLSKRDGDRALERLREEGLTPDALRTRFGFDSG